MRTNGYVYDQEISYLLPSLEYLARLRSIKAEVSRICLVTGPSLPSYNIEQNTWLTTGGHSHNCIIDILLEFHSIQSNIVALYMLKVKY